mgnify:CR=1 FL=1
MSELIIREFVPSDTEALKRILDESFIVDEFVTSTPPLDSVLEIYLRGKIIASTLALVVEKDEEVIGTIMLRVNDRPRIRSPFDDVATILRRLLGLFIVDTSDAKLWKEYLRYEASYARLRHRTKVSLEHEITLFMMAAAHRGQGIGSQLFAKAKEHMKEHGVRNFFLITDTDCTWQFYEARGMDREVSDSFSMDLRRGQHDLTTYLYSGTL